MGTAGPDRVEVTDSQSSPEFLRETVLIEGSYPVLDVSCGSQHLISEGEDERVD